MKTFWKILGLGALAIGLTPYKVEKDEETGENSYQALLWRITSTPVEGEGKREIGINLGEGTLTSMLINNTESGESHLFSDELCVEYSGAPVVTEAELAEPAAPAEPVEPAEPAEPEEPTAEEGKEEA